MKRVPSIDALRGLVMIIMALDHVRDFLHTGAMLFQPDDLARTTVPLFLTRWITHFCAPVFMFTAGLGAFFWFSRGRTRAQLSDFLWKRGLWLVFLDLVVLRFALFFSLTNGIVILNVLWALGWSMVILALLVHLPVRVLAILSVAVIALHNLLDGIPAAKFGAAAGLWNITHQLGVFQFGGVPVLAAYSLVPWFAVMAAGFCFGHVFPRRAAILGLSLTSAFLVVRAINIYGDPQPWSHQTTTAFTVLSFLRCAKYPPSLDFLLMTLGPSLLVLAWFGGLTFSRKNPLIVFGRVPLFFFLVHLFVAHGLAIPLALLRYGRAAFVLTPIPSMGGSPQIYPPGYGYSLPQIYLLWILVVVALYPLCLWFSRVKERRKDWWLSYL